MINSEIEKSPKKQTTAKEKAKELIDKYLKDSQILQAKENALNEANLFLIYTKREDVKNWLKEVVKEIEIY